MTDSKAKHIKWNNDLANRRLREFDWIAHERFKELSYLFQRYQESITNPPTDRESIIRLGCDPEYLDYLERKNEWHEGQPYTLDIVTDFGVLQDHLSGGFPCSGEEEVEY